MKSAAYKYKDEQEKEQLIKFLEQRNYILYSKFGDFIVTNYANNNDKFGFTSTPLIYSNRITCTSKKEFMKLANELAPNPKPIEPDLPQTFAITGKPHQLASIYQDLIDLGYKDSTIRPFKDWIGLNFSKITQVIDLGFFRQLYINNTLKIQDNIKYDIVFNLPEDYSRALKHAARALAHPFWGKNATRKKELGKEIKELVIDKNKLEEELTDICLRIDKLQSEKDTL